MKYDVVR